MAAQFAETGRLRIPNLLREADAARLHDALARRTPWNLFIIHDGPKVMPLAHWQALPPAERKFIDDQMAVAARDKFEARFLQCPLTETGEPFAGLIPELDGLARFLNGEPFLSFMRVVTGSAAIALCRCPGDLLPAPAIYLHRHTDEVPGKNRIVAYVLNLTPRWQPEWGGLLNFMRPDGQVGEAWVPSFNTLNLLRVPQSHFVGSVAGFVEAPRLAVTGWLRYR